MPLPSLMREIQDHYFREAKREGYLSRAAYKLLEIDDKKKILKPGDRVLDCGAAPGSWIQVAANRVGPRGMVVGIDLQELRHRAGANVAFTRGDLCATSAEELLRLTGDPSRKFDVVLSDMAPSTSGDHSADHFRSVQLCEAVLERCATVLRPGGNLAMKVFEGSEYPALVKRVAEQFESARGYKPKASRSESTEMYIVAAGFRGSNLNAGQTRAASVAPPRRPSSGWAHE
jgi:23S rRNA (uridine2552-2'-O)-methyltransferase